MKLRQEEALDILPVFTFCIFRIRLFDFRKSLGHFKCHFHTSIAPSLRAVCSASCPFHQVLCPFVLHCMCMRSNLSLSCLSLVQPTADAFSVCSQTSQMLFRRVLKSFQLNHIYINFTYIYLVWRCFEVELKPTLFRIPYPSQMKRLLTLRPLNTTQDRRNVLLDNRVGDNEIISTNAWLLSFFSFNQVPPAVLSAVLCGSRSC